MKKIIAYTLIAFVLTSCSNNSPSNVDTLVLDSVSQENIIADSEYDMEAEEERIKNTPWDELTTQSELNAKSIMEANELRDSVNLLTSYLRKNSPSPLLYDDIKEWTAYETAMSQSMVAFFMNDGGYSSIDMKLSGFISDYYRQRLISLDNICKYLMGQSTSNDKHGNISNNMLDEAYRKFKDAVNHSRLYEYYEDSVIAEMNAALTTEHKAWNKWIQKRESVASQLNGEVKRIYMNSTNELKRHKLIQLLNQYNGYGIMSPDIMEHLLNQDCTDKQLKSYPGFSIVWES